MTESEALFQISTIVNRAVSFSQAVDRISDLLKCEIDPRLDPLDSFDHADGSLYSVELRDGGKSVGKATVLFASNHFHGALHQRLAVFLGQQLGMLLARTRLTERRGEWLRELAKMEEDLATRKIMQRAEGVLVSKRGMPAILARQWIARESQKTGLSKRAVAERIIVYYQKTGLLEQRIA